MGGGAEGRRKLEFPGRENVRKMIEEIEEKENKEKIEKEGKRRKRSRNYPPVKKRRGSHI